MIDGLKVALTGEQIRKLIEQRAAEHRRLVTRWEREASRTSEEQTEDAPLLPQHLCESEIERHKWRADFLTFLHDHLDPAEVYRLSEMDLEFAELLPSPPAWLEDDEYEAATRATFDLPPYARRVCESPEIIEITNPDAELDEVK